MDDNPRIDPSKLDEPQRQALEKWSQNKQIISYLSDMADSFQAINILLKDSEATDSKKQKEMGALLTDMRESLTTLKDKETPESPDYAKPVVDALERLFKPLTASVKAIDVKPNVKVDAPQVNVDSPSVNVDLKGVEKVLKTDLPKAFKESMKLIPKPDKFDPKPLLDAYKELGKKLDDIDTGVRMKPMPGSTKISNLPFTAGTNSDYLDVQQTSSTVETYVFKLGGSTGSVVRTIVVTYTSSSKADIDTVEWS